MSNIFIAETLSLIKEIHHYREFRRSSFDFQFKIHASTPINKKKPPASMQTAWKYFNMEML